MIHLIYRFRGGGSLSTRVRTGGVVVFQGDVGTVRELKHKIFHSLAIPPHLQDYGISDCKPLTFLSNQIAKAL
jgi:hypothetical protein